MKSELGVTEVARQVHDRLIGGIHVGSMLSYTTSTELESVARRAGTLKVPQVAGTIDWLAQREREAA